MLLFLSEGLRPSDSPTRSLARRFAGALRSRGSLAMLARSLSASARVNHLPRVCESHSITAAVRDNDGAGCFVSRVSRPVALKLQEHLYPTRQASAGLLQPAERQLVTRRR